MYKLEIDLDKFSVENIPDLSNKKVILRSCLNVAVDDTGKVTDDTRIVESLPTIKFLADHAKQVIILGHLGRPSGYTKELSFWNVAEVLQEKLGDEHKVQFVKFETDPEFTSKVILFDNIRFFKDEESKDSESRMNFAKDLAPLGDVFVNDAFADYRESASTYDIAKVLPSYLGKTFLKEVEALSKFSNSNMLVSVLGGAKLSEKLDALNSLAEISEKVIVGGAMAYTILKAQGIEIGKSLFEEDKLELAKDLINKYGNKLVLPVDHLVATEFSEEASKSAYNTSDENVPEGKVAIDIGRRTIELFKDTLSIGNYVLWNGPMGVFEWQNSSKGTVEVVKAIVGLGDYTYKLAGGGDSIVAINKFGFDGFNHICTGGGAMMAFIAYSEFPTLDAIVKK